MPDASADKKFRDAAARLEGRTLSKVEKLPPCHWVFQFGTEVVLRTESEWRVLSAEAILITSEDDGQQYGLPAPVDAQETVGRLLETRVVAKADVNQASADLAIHFDNGTVLQIVNLSSGYEAWTLTSEGDLMIVGRNGCS